jgi:hypothetical protein
MTGAIMAAAGDQRQSRVRDLASVVFLPMMKTPDDQEAHMRLKA